MPNIHLLKYNETSFLFFFAQYYYYMYSYTTALMWLLNQAHKNQSSVSRNFYSFLKNLDKRSKSRWILWRNCKMWNVRWYYITHIASYNPTTWKYMHVYSDRPNFRFGRTSAELRPNFGQTSAELSDKEWPKIRFGWFLTMH